MCVSKKERDTEVVPISFAVGHPGCDDQSAVHPCGDPVEDLLEVQPEPGWRLRHPCRVSEHTHTHSNPHTVLHVDTNVGTSTHTRMTGTVNLMSVRMS